ncbi:exopolysaccharide Pel transporter PelG [Sulfurovum sp. bin170]|uniref:exopolysaccharide Pel transporter PelG n=1 Tax=Sulfurovum sp. bin170 TaxID=2695268 RepID=UPI0013DF8807|nr:exopolysaccharide Pel transporter PelG [Sulfurovum sp. bin170]NEW60937.1 exopolysaccharide Pel transporter PelG [Sulfurovum sp. bin170]
MAGIGFELKQIIREKSITSVFKTFGYSAVLSSGPWVISMIIILGIGLTSVYLSSTGDPHEIMLKASVTYVSALALSSIFTGFFQLPFTRFVADRIYEKKEYLILPNFIGTLSVTVLLGFLISLPLAIFLFDTQSNLFVLLYVSLFIVLSCVWIANILAASLKLYRLVIIFYLLGYGAIYGSFIFLREYEVIGYLLSFLIGNTLLFVMLSLGITYYYPAYSETNKKFIRLDMFQNRFEKFYWKLALSGVFYNIAIWIDKAIFWFTPIIGYAVIDKLHASMVYDFPIFLAYLSIIPGMAIFFFRLEVDFADAYDRFYRAVNRHGTLEQIKKYKQGMIDAVTRSIQEVLFVQGMFNLLLFLSAESLFELLMLPKLYLPLFYVDVIGVQLQLGFMSILAYLYYLDRQKEALIYTLSFVLLNALLTWISIQLGPYFYGYGFSVTLLILFVASIYTLNNILQELDYKTFMLQ